MGSTGSTGSQSPLAATDALDSGLDERDRQILAFELENWAHAGAKDDAIRTQFGLPSGRYYQLLNALIDSPAAYVYDPQLIRRLQRVRQTRMGDRTMATMRATTSRDSDRTD